jgi:hypothetical protein
VGNDGGGIPPDEDIGPGTELAPPVGNDGVAGFMSSMGREEVVPLLRPVVAAGVVGEAGAGLSGFVAPGVELGGVVMRVVESDGVVVDGVFGAAFQPVDAEGLAVEVAGVGGVVSRCSRRFPPD